MVKSLLFFVVFVILVTASRSQDIHEAQAQEMNIWYNPSLKTNKIPAAILNFRNVNYPAITSYSSKSATIELPLIGGDRDAGHTAFGNLAAGMNADNSSDRFMAVTTAMLSFSYALPLNYLGTYLAIGFQGKYTTSRVGVGSYEYFPRNFDKFGALGSAIAADPYQSGYSFGYFSAGTGAAVFHDGENRQWYVGGSILHFNRPYTEWNRVSHLRASHGIQAGYNSSISNVAAIGAYVNFSWRDSIHEHCIGGLYTRNLDDSATIVLSLGIGYRIGDAIIPNLGFSFRQHYLAFYYELDAPGATKRNYGRRAYAVSYRFSW